MLQSRVSSMQEPSQHTLPRLICWPLTPYSAARLRSGQCGMHKGSSFSGVTP
jgi:hypothetical protein